MERINNTKVQLTLNLIVFLFILLFAYTGLYKLIDLDQTRGTLRAVPILKKMGISEIVAWLVPVIEVLVAVVLSIPARRKQGLYGAMVLMVIFTLYVFYILKLSGEVPCTCGGVISKMNWTTHLYFNIFFTILSIAGVALDHKLNKFIPQNI